MRFVAAPAVVAILVLAMSLTPLHAQVDSREGIALQNEIYQLRQELKAVEDQLARGGNRSATYAPQQQQQQQQAPANDLLAQLLTRVDALEEQVRQLRGRIDETQNQLQRQNDDLGKRIDDLAFQISPQAAQIAKPASPAAQNQEQAPTQPIPPPPARPASPPAPHTPEMMLQDGNAALSHHDYATAESLARAILANRTSPRAYDARLLLAQSLYGQKQYAQAAIAFDDAFNSARKGNHAQEALLGLANSLSAINEKKAACDTLTRLHTDFPQLRTDVAATATVIAQKSSCR